MVLRGSLMIKALSLTFVASLLSEVAVRSLLAHSPKHVMSVSSRLRPVDRLVLVVICSHAPRQRCVCCVCMPLHVHGCG